MIGSVKNALVGHMCYQFANEVECMSQVSVNPETGEFDASQAFKDMLDFSEGESSKLESEFLLIGTQRFEVTRFEDSSNTLSNEGDSMLLRVVDLEALRAAFAQANQQRSFPRPRP